MRVGIVGSRNFNDYDLLERVIKENIDIDDIDKVISGGAQGADRLGERFATINKIEKNIYYPDWNRYGRQAGFLRNIKIVRNSDIVFAFWDGESHGTKHSIDLCKQHNKKIIVQKFKGEYMNKVIMIDGNNVAHICFHSAQNVVRRQNVVGEDRIQFLEGMTYHLFFNKLISFMKQFQGHYFITWDVKKSRAYRQEISNEYKSNRDTVKENPDLAILYRAMNNLRDIMPSLPVYQYIEEGFEADDIIFQCASEANKYGSEIIIISNDTDMLQIVQRYPNIRQFNPKKNIFMEAPHNYNIAVFKALAGDSTDHVLGVKGVGKVTAEKWAKEVYCQKDSSRLKHISSFLKENKEKIEQFKQSFELVNIESNPNLINLKIDINYLYKEKDCDFKKIGEFFKDYNMKSQLNNFEKTIQLFKSLYLKVSA